jgi:hypothetical protein
VIDFRPEQDQQRVGREKEEAGAVERGGRGGGGERQDRGVGREYGGAQRAHDRVEQVEDL